MRGCEFELGRIARKSHTKGLKLHFTCISCDREGFTPITKIRKNQLIMMVLVLAIRLNLPVYFVVIKTVRYARFGTTLSIRVKSKGVV